MERSVDPTLRRLSDGTSVHPLDAHSVDIPYPVDILIKPKQGQRPLVEPSYCGGGKEKGASLILLHLIITAAALRKSRSPLFTPGGQVGAVSDRPQHRKPAARIKRLEAPSAVTQASRLLRTQNRRDARGTADHGLEARATFHLLGHADLT
jgi:hypothetical protein